MQSTLLYTFPGADRAWAGRAYECFQVQVSVWKAVILAATLGMVDCGSNNLHPLPCGTTDACFAQQFLFASTDSGQILSFPIDRSTGALGTARVMPGAQQSLGIAQTGAAFRHPIDGIPASRHRLAVVDALSLVPGGGGGGTVTTTLTIALCNVLASKRNARLLKKPMHASLSG